MRLFLKLSLCVIAMSGGLPLLAGNEAETNSTFLKVVQSSNDVSTILKLVPEVEKLYRQNPEAYLKSLNQCVRDLRGESANRAAKQAYTNLFTSMMQKPCPKDTNQAIAWVELKGEIISGWDQYQLRDDKPHLLAIAKYIKEIRSRIIPNYPNEGRAVTFMVPGHPEEVDKIIEEVKRNEPMGRLQAVLRRSEAELLFDLHEYSRQLLHMNPTNAAFIKELGTAANLTKEETSQLLQPEGPEIKVNP